MKIQDLNGSKEIDMSAVHGGATSISVAEFNQLAPAVADAMGAYGVILLAQNVDLNKK